MSPLQAQEGESIDPSSRFFIKEYRIRGAEQLKRVEIERAVYPYLGPKRSVQDVESARRAIEELYQENGYQTVMVEIPQQEVTNGVVLLQVTEGEVGRLRVRGSRYFDIEKIKERAPSLAEGTVPNFNQVSRDIVALNQLPNRTVIPELKPGAEPGTVDIDLRVEDRLPFKASVELNNRYSASTSELRLNVAASYENLWQAGHTLGGNIQTSPLEWEEVLVYSGFYIVRIPEHEQISIMVQATKQDTDVSTAGGVAVAGRGENIGITMIYTLPTEAGHFHSISAGIQSKNYEQELRLNNRPTATPIEYYPMSLLYSSIWGAENSMTELYTGLNFNFRGWGSDPREWDNNRFNADGSFMVFHAELAHTHDLPEDFQVFARGRTQWASGPLISNEQYTGGGLDSVRGYLEAEVLGDQGAFATLEVRGPNFLHDPDELERALRPHVFFDTGYLEMHDALPQQEANFRLASFGAGARMQLNKHFSGSLTLGVPVISQSESDAWDPRLTFVLRGEL